MAARQFVKASFWFVIAALGACDRSTGPRTGSLTVTINGLPAEIPAAVTITTPKQTVLTATTTRTLSDLDPGTYQIAASNAASDKSTFAPVNVTSVVEVVAGTPPTEAVVNYSVITAIVSLSITGVPTGATPFVVLSGNGISKTLTTPGESGNLIPGDYSITASNVDDAELYGGIVSPATFTLSASVTAFPVSVAYSPITGSVALSSSGLPQGASAMWGLAGPGSFSRTVTGAGPVVASHLPPGQYSVAARNISYGGETYGSTSGSTLVTVTAGQSATVTTSYIIRPPTFNLTIAGAYFVQSTQNFSGTVPLVAGRDAYLRVFVRGNESNNANPQVRVRFYRGGQLISTQVIAAPTGSVPTATSEASITDSWGVLVSGSLLQAGTSFVADVDPDYTVREITDSDNQYPVNGIPALLDVRTVAPVNIRFVPISTGDGLIGNVTAARIGELLNLTLRMHPMSSMSADVRSTYSTTNVFVDDDTNNAWSKILSEIEVIRVAEGSGRYYVGIVKDNGHSKWGGIGYRPGKSTVSIDYGAASEIIPHELGHNWGRAHAPCGNPSGTDPSYPYSGGIIGRYGFDQSYSRILPPGVPDVMSYCWLPTGFNVAAPRQWVSDYTYAGVLNYRSSNGAAVVADETVQHCLIVWGRVTRNGVVLEPAFTAMTKPVLPTKPGRFSLKVLDANGGAMSALSFDPQEVADGGEPESHFVFAIPIGHEQSSRIASLSLSGSGFAPVIRVSPSIGATPPSISMTTPRANFVRLQWDAKSIPLLVVTDPATHEIISLARSGDALVRTQGRSLNVKASNGVRSMEINLRQ